VIAFNLLPHREALRKFKQDQFNASVVLTLILGGVTALGMYGLLRYSTAAHQDNISVLEQEIRRYESQIIEIQDVKTQIDFLLARQKAFEDIQADRSSPVRLLSELADILPPGVALSKLAQKGQEITLEGTAQTNENLSQFLDKLGEGGAWFSRPELLVSEAQHVSPGGKLPVKAFKFSVKATFMRDPAASAAELPSIAASAAAPSSFPKP
jgi:type IV pilus assembly protein PilN